VLFAWQGFSLEHPDDWAPALLNGERRRGYARLSSPGKVSLQVRWQHVARRGDLHPSLQAYFKRLERDARRAKLPFKSDVEEDPDGLRYRWVGRGQARGVLFFSERCRRIFWVEAVGERDDSLLPLFRTLSSGFRSQGADGLEQWSLLGLSFRAPAGLSVEEKLFQAGRTRLRLGGKGCRIEAERWGFGTQLAERHGLEGWARDALKLRKAVARAEGGGLRFVHHRRPWMPRREALLALDSDRNQITFLACTFRAEARRPSWDWLT
jgi:hypothetical protein